VPQICFAHTERGGGLGVLAPVRHPGPAVYPAVKLEQQDHRSVELIGIELKEDFILLAGWLLELIVLDSGPKTLVAVDARELFYQPKSSA